MLRLKLSLHAVYIQRYSLSRCNLEGHNNLCWRKCHRFLKNFVLEYSSLLVSSIFTMDLVSAILQRPCKKYINTTQSYDLPMQDCDHNHGRRRIQKVHHGLPEDLSTRSWYKSSTSAKPWMFNKETSGVKSAWSILANQSQCNTYDRDNQESCSTWHLLRWKYSWYAINDF